nr:hypothetical protein [Rhodoferax sp.]
MKQHIQLSTEPFAWRHLGLVLGLALTAGNCLALASTLLPVPTMQTPAPTAPTAPTAAPAAQPVKPPSATPLIAPVPLATPVIVNQLSRTTQPLLFPGTSPPLPKISLQQPLTFTGTSPPLPTITVQQQLTFTGTSAPLPKITLQQPLTFTGPRLP